MMKRYIALLLSISLLLSVFVFPVSAEGTNAFTVKVCDATATAGDSLVAVDILLENNPGLAGFSFCVNYNTDKLVLVRAEVDIDYGYQVSAQLEDYGVNLAWTGVPGYAKDGKIATLYFNAPKDVPAGDAAVEIVYRDGYDSFYDANEEDFEVQTQNGKITVDELQETSSPSVSVGTASANFETTEVVVPITVSNNPGFSGFSFCINYDTSRLVLESANILLDGGYKVVGHPEGYGVNLAWTSADAYTQDGTVAELRFSVKDNAVSGKAFVNVEYRDGYDSFYSFFDGSEQDIAFTSYSGYVDVSSHIFGEWVVTTPATCTSTGLKTRTCQDCSKTETLVIPKTDHEYEAVVTPPTCIAKGYTTHTCKNCPDYYVDTYVEMVDHTPGEWTQSIAPECEIKGEEIQKCTICQTTLDTREVDATGHMFGDWYQVTAATFNTDGEERRDCTKCDHYETNRIPKLSESHTCSFTGREEVVTPATCTEAGSKNVYCSVTECGKYTTVAITATGHTYGEWYTVTEPTFDTDGEQRRDCDNCDHFETNRLPKLSESHTCTFSGTEEIVEPATCTESGSKKVYCSNPDCGQYTTVSIDPTGHTNGEWTVTQAATCTEQGLETISCTVCQTVIQSRPIDATGHSWGTGVVTKQPDCMNTGEKTFTCSSCEEKDVRELPMTGHTEGEWETITNATCTTPGLKELHCTVCNELIASDTIAATGHKLGGWTVRVEPTETEPGESVRSCSECDYEETAVIEATGSVPKIIVDSVQASRGGTVKVAISLANNPGIASMRLNVDYDSSVMTLVGVDDLDKLGSELHSNRFTDPYVLCWANDTATENFTANGDVVILTFEVSETAASGSYEVSVSYDYDKADIHNVQVEKVRFYTEVGTVEVVDVLIGDVNGDGSVDTLDRLTLSRYLANWDGYTIDQINTAGADVNCDGSIDTLDRLTLSRYLANWDGYETLPHLS